MTTRFFQFRFAGAEQHWLITFTFFRCQRMKQSAATGILNGLALDYLSTIFLVMGLDIMFLIAYRCVACSVRHWEPWACLAHCRQFLWSVQVEFLPVLLRHWCRGSNSGYMLRDTCRGYSLHKAVYFSEFSSANSSDKLSIRQPDSHVTTNGLSVDLHFPCWLHGSVWLPRTRPLHIFGPTDR